MIPPVFGQQSTAGKQTVVSEREQDCELGPTEFFHGPSSVPDFGHVLNLVASEIHDINVVRCCALTCWGTWTALASMRGRKYTVGANALRVGPESSYRIAELSQHQAD
jgi:hypothetical protein